MGTAFRHSQNRHTSVATSPVAEVPRPPRARALQSSDRNRLIEDIKALALEYGLMSKFTAFIAVDAAQKTAGGHGYTVAQPVPVPHGVRYDTTVAE